VTNESEFIHGNAAGGPDSDINVQGERIQKLLGRIEQFPHPGARELIQECMEAVLAFYGQGLSRILQIARDAGPEGGKVYRDLIHDDIIRGFLLIHDLHPLTLEARLREALDEVRPYLKSHGGNVELINLENDIARLRLQGTCKSCASSSVTLELAIRHAVEQACPDLVHFEVEGVVPDKGPAPGLPPSRRTTADWAVIQNVQQLAEGGSQTGDWLFARSMKRFMPTAIAARPAICPSTVARFITDSFLVLWDIATTCGRRAVVRRFPTLISILFRFWFKKAW
jgi:Fe-S cluster biogenesis protein NfuA